jgi:uncharacterized membrane protein YbhN (UPF0104 family)
VVGLGILVVVLAGVDPAGVAEALAGTDVPLVVLGVLGLTAAHLVPAAGWRAILATTTGIRLAWRTAIRLYYASQAIGGVTPANLGGDVHRAGSLRRSGHDWSAAVAPLVVQRATSYLALSTLAAVALAYLAARTPMASGIVLGGLAVAAIAAVAAWLLLAPPGFLHGLRDRLIRSAGAGPVPLRAAVLIGVGHGMAFHALAIGLTAAIVLAVEPAAPVGAVLAVLAVARLSLAVPITPSGLGVQEGAAAVLFGAIGLAPGVALGALLLTRLSLVLTTLIGVALLQRRDVVVPPRTAPGVAH